MLVVRVGLRVALAALACYAMYDSAKAWSGDWFINFTSQANLLLAIVLLWSAASVIFSWREPPPWLRGGVVLYLGITALVYAFIIGYPAERPYSSLFGLTNTEILHGVTPALAFLLWVLFAEHRRLTWKWTFLWLAYLYGYLAVMLIRARISPESGYPYHFIDLDQLGWSGLASNMASYTVLFVSVGAAVIALDRRLPARTRLTDVSRKTLAASTVNDVAVMEVVHA